MSSTTKLVKTICQITYDARNYALLNSSINTLSKKHGQLKGAVQAMVELSIGWLDEIKQQDGVEKWLELVETLRAVTEGKVRRLVFLLYPKAQIPCMQIFLETPRARVTLLLSKYHEELADSPNAKTPKEALQTASDLLSDLQVETYSSMERKEKTEFILEQMRLLIAVAKMKDETAAKDGKDSLADGDPEWTKVRVGSRKINEDFLKVPENQVCYFLHRKIGRV